MESQPIKVLPWIGSYFGIPEPVEGSYIPFTDRVQSEIEMHILKKDLSVRTVILRYAHHEAFLLDDEIWMQLKNMAYVDDEAIAFMLHPFIINSETGERERSSIIFYPQMRVGKTEWKTIKGQIVKPDIYDIIQKYRNYKR